MTEDDMVRFTQHLTSRVLELPISVGGCPQDVEHLMINVLTSTVVTLMRAGASPKLFDAIVDTARTMVKLADPAGEYILH